MKAGDSNQISTVLLAALLCLFAAPILEAHSKDTPTVAATPANTAKQKSGVKGATEFTRSNDSTSPNADKKSKRELKDLRISLKRSIVEKQKVGGSRAPDENDYLKLAQLDDQLGDLSSAEKDFLAAIEKAQSSVIYDSGNTVLIPEVECKTLLADFYLRHRRIAKAEATALDALTCARQRVGPKNPLVEKTLRVLARIYCQQNRNAEAEASYFQALNLLVNATGPGTEFSSPTEVTIQGALNEYVDFLNREERREKGSLLIDMTEKRVARNTRERVQREAQQRAQNIPIDSSKYLSEQAWDEPEKMSNELERDNCVVPKAHKKAQLVQSNKPDLSTDSKYKKAIVLANANVFFDNGDTISIPLVDAKMRLADFYLRNGKLDRAESEAKESLSIARAQVNPNKPLVAEPLSLLGKIYLKQNRISDAAKCYEQALDLLVNATGANMETDNPSDERIQKALSEYMSVLHFQKNEDKIAKIRQSTQETVAHNRAARATQEARLKSNGQNSTEQYVPRPISDYFGETRR